MKFKVGDKVIIHYLTRPDEEGTVTKILKISKVLHIVVVDDEKHKEHWCLPRFLTKKEKP